MNRLAKFWLVSPGATGAVFVPILVKKQTRVVAIAFLRELMREVVGYLVNDAIARKFEPGKMPAQEQALWNAKLPELRELTRPKFEMMHAPWREQLLRLGVAPKVVADHEARVRNDARVKGYSFSELQLQTGEIVSIDICERRAA